MIILDNETTGSGVENASRYSIIDIAAMEFENPSNFFHMECRMRDGAEVDKRALEYNGFTLEEITDPNKPSYEEAIRKFHNWTKSVKDRTISGQNVDYDIAFMKEGYKIIGLEWDLGYRKVDQHSIVYSVAKRNNLIIPLTKDLTSNFGSDTIMEFVGIPAEPKPHKAPNGVIWEAEAMSRLIYGKSLLSRFKDFEVPKYLRNPIQTI